MDSSPSKLCFVSYTPHGGAASKSPLFRSMACYQLAAYLRSHPKLAAAYDILIETFESTTFWGEGWGAEDDLRALQKVLGTGANVLAFSLYVWNSERLHAFARALKQLAPHLTLIAGGPEAYGRPDFVELFPAFDIVIEGDGERPLRDVLLRLCEGEGDLTGLRNVSFRRDGSWVHNPSGASTTDAEEIPDYLSEQPALLHGRGYYLSVRGCPKGCDYCLWARQPMSAKRRERVIRDLDALLSSDALLGLTLCDYDAVELHRHDPELFRAMAELYAKHQGGGRLTLFASPQGIIDPAVGMLFDTLGIDTLVIGLQSGSVDALTAVNRGWAAAPIELFDRVPAELRSRFRVELIFPLPGETAESFLGTVRRLLAYGYVRLRIFNLLILRGTKLYRRREHLGLRCLPRPPYLCYETPLVPAAQVHRFSALAKALTLLGGAADSSREAARTLSDYCRSHPDLADRLLADLDAGRAVEVAVASILHGLIPSSSLPSSPDTDDSPMRALGRELVSLDGDPAPCTSAPAEVPRPQAAAAPNVALLPAFQAFFARRQLALVRSRRDGDALVFDLASSLGNFSITLGPKRAGAVSFDTTKFYDINYSGQTPDLPAVVEFVRLVRTLEARARKPS